MDQQRLFDPGPPDPVVPGTGSPFGRMLQQHAGAGHLKVRAPSHAAEMIARDGVIKTQHETGTGEGIRDTYARTQVESARGQDRPVYGYLNPAQYDNVAEGYGDVTMHMKGATRDRSHMTATDSMAQYSLTGEATTHDEVGYPYSAPIADVANDRTSLARTIHKETDEKPAYYVEAQIPRDREDGLSVEDNVARVTVHHPLAHRTNPPRPDNFGMKAAAEFAKRGIPVEHTRWQNIVQEPLPGTGGRSIGSTRHQRWQP